MKFKATWRNESVSVVPSAIISVLRGGCAGDSSNKSSTIKVSPDKFFFTSGGRRRDQSESWCCVTCKTTFSSVICESLRDNIIDMAIPTQSLIMVLRYVAQSIQCTMRLTKRNMVEPVLRFEFNFVDSGNCLVVHDVPVEVLKQDEFIWTEPLIPDADTRIVLSYPLKRIVSYMDQTRHMDPESKVNVRFENFVAFSNMTVSCACESVRSRLKIANQQVFQPTQTAEADIRTGPCVSEVWLTLRGILYALDRVVLLSETCKCLLLASENKYVSLWVQLPNQFGSVAAITPAIILG